MERTKKVMISFTDEEYDLAKRICKPGQPFSTYVRVKALQGRKLIDDKAVHLEELKSMAKEAEARLIEIRTNIVQINKDNILKTKDVQEEGSILRNIGKMIHIYQVNIDELRRISLEADGNIKLIEKKVDNWGHLGENKFEELLRKQEEVIKGQKANLYWIVSGVSVLILLSILTFLPL